MVITILQIISYQYRIILMISVYGIRFIYGTLPDTLYFDSIDSYLSVHVGRLHTSSKEIKGAQSGFTLYFLKT